MRGGPRPGAGRPAKPRDEARTERVTVWLTPAELAALDAARGGALRGEHLAAAAGLRQGIAATSATVPAQA